MKREIMLAALAAASVLAAPARAQVSADWVRAHETFLAGDELRGRGSATPDEAIAAAYVAAQFRGFGLQPAPGIDGYLQKAQIVRLQLKAPITLTANGVAVPGARLLVGDGTNSEGVARLTPAKALSRMAPSPVMLVTGDMPPMQLYRLARSFSASRLLLIRESADTQALLKALHDEPRLPGGLYSEARGSSPSIVALPAAAFDALAAQQDVKVALTVPVEEKITTTTNAIGFLPGTDPKAGVLLLTAHLDHLGVQADGTIMHGANDDASGTTAVLELARTLAAKGRTKRGILFVAYGAEEIGGYGSTYFGAHPPVPLDQIVANVEVEMIGAQDPKLPAGTMMMTGYERSTLGETLKAHGALVTADPYPEQNFFQRSDNYSLATKGVVAHTISGWAVTPTYHSKDDTVANIDIAFMTRAIQSLVEPLHALANSDAKPEWKPGGKPE